MSVAKKAVSENDTWAENATYSAEKEVDGRWSIMAWTIEGYDKDGEPLSTPGGHRLIMIDKNGKVTAYQHGR